MYANERDRLQAAKLAYQDLVDRCREFQSSNLHYLDSIQRDVTYYTEVIVKWMHPLEEHIADCRKHRSAIILEQERLSRSVIDLVLAWKWNKSEDWMEPIERRNWLERKE